MKRPILLLLLVPALIIAALVIKKTKPSPIPMTTIFLKVESPAFTEGDKIPTQYTCDGEGKSPPLAVKMVPEEAKSLALIVDDPDAPSGTFTHWLVWNIDPKKPDFPEGRPPTAAVVGKNSANLVGFTPPCPPSGVHRYFFKVYALKNKLDLPAGSDRRTLEKAIADLVIASGQLLGKYSRQ